MSYSITIPGTDQPKTYAQKAAAVKFVDKQAAEGTVLQVVDAETNLVVHVGDPVAGSRHFHPFERLESPKTTAPSYEGFVPAYHRKRIDATVYRGLDEFGLKGTWRIYDGRSGKFRDVSSTKEACTLTREMKEMQL